MELKQRLAERLGLTGDEQDWHSICCPLHDDNNPSAAIHWAFGRFICRAGCGNFSLQGLADEILDDEVTVSDTQATLELLQQVKEGSAVTSVPEKEAIEHLKAFLKQRGISRRMYEEVGAKFDTTPNSPTFGYISFPFEETHYVNRKFIPHLLGPRYNNSKGAKHFYGIENLDAKGDVILVEGIYDLLALRQLGFKNVVASLSSNFNEQSAYDLRGRTVFILFDADYAGFKGTQKAVETFTAIQANPIPLDIEALSSFGRDPHQVFCNQPQALTNWLHHHISQYDSADGKYIKDIFLTNRDALRYYPSSLPTFDRLLGGGFKEGCHVIAGEPAVGKSSLSIWLSVQMVQAGARVLYCTYEITKRQCWARVASQFDVLNWEQIEMDPTQVSLTTRAKLEILSDKMRIVAGWSIQEIERACGNYDVIVVDYIQRMPGHSADVRTNVSQNSQKLSNLGLHSRKVILCISSLSRSGYKQESGMGALKESGDIEYVAQSITRLHGTGVNNSTLIAKMLKNTRGPLGQIWLMANLGASKFQETDPITVSEGEDNEGTGKEYGL